MDIITLETMPRAIMDLNRKVDTLLSMQSQTSDVNEDYLMPIEELENELPEKPARQTIYGWVNDRKIPFEKHGRRLYFRKSSIDNWLANGRRIK